MRKSKLGDLIIHLNSQTLSKDELIKNGQYPVVNSGTSYYGYYEKYNNNSNTITVASRGSYAGFVNYLNQKFWAGGLCYPFRSKDETQLLTKYLFYFLKNKESFMMRTLVKKGSIPAINKEDFNKLEISIPSIKIQQKIVYVLDNFDKICSDLNIGLPSEIDLRQKQYEYYRDKLLAFNKSKTNK